MRVQPELFLVALEGSRLVGTAMSGFDGHRGWVYYLAVLPEHRRRGVGRALMRRVEAELATRGCPKINLQVRSTNRQAVSFYRHLGYQVEDRISMGKRLEPDDER
jgi:ribosomal protein S18 acetylase RimI-like enzyme